MYRKVPTEYRLVWWALAALFAAALFASGELSWWLSLASLAWFGVWETHGIVRHKTDETLSFSVWTILDVQDHHPKRKALVPLVMGIFAAASAMFVGVVDGSATLEMSTAARVIAACFVAAGTLLFLRRHFARGDSL